MKLIQQQVQQLNQQQLLSVELLQMGVQELDAYLRELAQENPLVDLEDTASPPEPTDTDQLLGRLTWLEDNDRQNCYYQHVDTEDLDPLAQVGTSGGLEETLVRFVSRQLFRQHTSVQLTRRVCYLAACLDHNGYLSQPLPELAAAFGCSTADMNEALMMLHTLEPAGIGARDLSQCLELQLMRIGESDPALAIVRSHLPALAKGQFHAISKALSISQEQVRQAAAMIRELEPRPGAIFDTPEPVRYIQPDVLVVEEDGHFVPRLRTQDQARLKMNPYYMDLLKTSGDSEVRTYLQSKLHQVESVLFAINQRESTLQRCAKALVDRQQDFFRVGPAALRPVTMREIAEELEIHESTVSRAVREKFVQCAHGVFPLRYFFSSNTSASESGTQVSTAAAQAVLKSIIAEEDKQHPLSDQQLSERMAQAGCPISRRTVSKYRDELNIPNASGRRI